jgi:hypothetical protein
MIAFLISSLILALGICSWAGMEQFRRLRLRNSKAADIRGAFLSPDCPLI